jgi:hypothetical protein
VIHFYYTSSWRVAEQWEEDGAELELERAFVWGVKGLDDLALRETFAAEALATRLWALSDGKNVTAIADENERIGGMLFKPDSWWRGLALLFWLAAVIGFLAAFWARPGCSGPLDYLTPFGYALLAGAIGFGFWRAGRVD